MIIKRLKFGLDAVAERRFGRFFTTAKNTLLLAREVNSTGVMPVSSGLPSQND